MSINWPTIELVDASPALFAENRGQWADESIRYAFHGSGANVLHTDSGPVFQLFRCETPQEVDKPAEPQHAFDLPGESAEPEEAAPRYAEFSVRFDGANLVQPVGLGRTETVYNYYLGGQANWRTGVPTCETVAYMNLYDGIDLYTRGKRDSLKYEFHVAPGVDYRRIQVSCQGIEGLWLDGRGALHVETALGELVDDAPYIYQQIDGRQVEVAGDFKLIDADTYSFDITGDYDPNRELIVDPDLAWGSFLGGSDDEYGYGIAVDAEGNALMTGLTQSSDFPAPDGFDTSLGGFEDAFVAKMTSSGDLAWASFLGGSGGDRGISIAVDAAGNALVTGLTQSSDFPTPDGFDTSFGGSEDAFVAKVTSSGDLAWASFLGGSHYDYSLGIAVDAAGSALMTGQTSSSDFPTPDGFDTSLGGSSDAFVAKVTSSGDLAWGSFLGGSGYDFGYGIAVDTAGSALITGLTESSDFPTPDGFDTSLGGSSDAFVAKVTSSGDRAWASFLGGSDFEYGLGIAVDATGSALITGRTQSSDFPTPGGFDTSLGGFEDAFVAKATSSGDLAWASFLGGSSDDFGYGIAVDAAGSALLTGLTESSDFPTPDGFDTDLGGSKDAFVAAVTSSAELAWASFVGGSSDEFGHGIAVDAAGSALITGHTRSSDFPTPDGFDTSFGGSRDAFVAKVSGAGAPRPPEVIHRRIFYNNSAFDGGDPNPNTDDDQAIATDKEALRAPGTATFANYTSYGLGINGIMLDVRGLPEGVIPDADDFEFTVGNSDDPSTWAAVLATPTIAVRPGHGKGGSDRVTIVWPDGSIRNQWLEVKVKKDTDLGLLADDVFYFGNAVGEAGNSHSDAQVTATDLLLARNNPRSALSAGIEFPYDFNRDRQVDRSDVLLARDNQTNFLNALKLIDVSSLEGEGEGENSLTLTSCELNPTPPATELETAGDATEFQKLSAHDAVWTQTFGRKPHRQETPSAKMDWLCDCEQIATTSRPAKKHDPAAELLDQLLATCWE